MIRGAIFPTCTLLCFILFFVACKKEADCIDSSLINRNAPCFDVREPICGCDGNTYSNECEATKSGLTNWKNGKCFL